MADLDLELRKKSGFDSLALLAFLPAVVNFSFFTQNKEGGASPLPPAPPLDTQLRLRR